MTHFDEKMFDHHDGRGNLRASLKLIVDALKKLSADVESLKAGAPAPVAPKLTAKISTDEVVTALKTKVSDVVVDVEAEVKTLENEVVKLVNDVEDFVEEKPVLESPVPSGRKKK